MAEQEIRQLKEKLQAQEKQFQNYKTQCKQLEEFLEDQSKKKQSEIRKLKQEAINKEKAFKLLKTQISQLETQCSTLKAEAGQNKKQQNNQSVQEIKKLQQSIQEYKKQIGALTKEVQQSKTVIGQKQQQSATFLQKISVLEEQSKSLEGEVQAKNIEIAQKDQQIVNLKESLQNKASELKNSPPAEKIEKKTSKKQESHSKDQNLEKEKEKLIKEKEKIEKQKEKIEKQKQKLQKQIQKLQKDNTKLEQKVKKSEDTFIKYEKQIKQLKSKIGHISEQNATLQSKLSQGPPPSFQKEEEQGPIESTMQHNIGFLNSNDSKISFACVLLTKQHYISPFLEVIDRNNLKIFKSTKNGCFQKSLGSVKHRLDAIVYNYSQLIDQIVAKIKQSEYEQSHSIVIYGVKKSTKKYIMAQIVQKLKDFLLEKIENSQNETEALYVKRSVQEQKNFQQNGKTKDEISQIIEKVIALGSKSEKKSDKLISVKKAPSKPKVRYFSVQAGEFFLQISTSSHTSNYYRQKMSQHDMLNNILYSKLPKILQSTNSCKYIILTLNPIVSFYEDCKNTLSITLCKNITQMASPNKDQEWKDWKNSPIKEEQLNDFAKKKLQSYERQNQQTSLKIKKLEEECGFYKHKFDQLQVRLKSLLNTHQEQNSYLKKSPVTLSYQKMLKFVHNVQSRTPSNLSLTNFSAIKVNPVQDSIQSDEAL